MTAMKYILQIFTGSWHGTHDEPEDIVRRIGEISSRIPVEMVIMGWNTDPSVYAAAGRFLHGAGIRMLLWLPVFSETGEAAETDEALDLYGNRIIMPAEMKGEGFVFGCPSSRRNLHAVRDLYEKYFSGCGFDGVFLDRVRTQSFLAGVPGVLSCGCARCRKAFRDRGVDTDAVREQYARKRDAFFNMASFPMNGQFRLEDALAQRFFEAKEEIVAAAAAEISGYFREKGMIVGLDLFAPAVSRFVGQSYSLITKTADFIKPMLYRRTEAPAGIGYEYSLFRKSAPGAQGRRGLSMDREFLDTQLETAGNVACEVFPGIEINYSRELVSTDPEYITESLEAIRDHGFAGAVLCWNIMEAPAAHLEAVAGMEKR